MEDVSLKVTALTRRLIQSRILELKIVEHRIPPPERNQVEADRKELEELLRHSK